MNHYRWEELFIGQKETFSVTVTQEMLNCFGQITGDISPIHIDKYYARTCGFQNQVVYGMLTASFLSTLVGVYLPGEHALFQQVESTFLRPVYVGDTLTISGEIVNCFDAFQQVDIKISIHNQKQEKVLRGKIKVGVR
jgi:Acyl dehydratase